MLAHGGLLVSEIGLFVVGPRHALFPANARTKHQVARLKTGDLVNGKVIKSRSPELNAATHVVLAHVAEGLGVPIEKLKTELKKALGYVDLVQRSDGTIEPSPHRLDFEKCDEEDFREFWNHAEPLLGELVAQMPVDAERDRILDLMEGRR
jgi:hypothetical protein